MTDHRDLKSARGLWLCRFPLLTAVAVICLLNGFSLYRLVSAAAPRNPWEAIEIVEAWRSLQGMPVYELSREAHATHMYGALVPWLQGEMFRWIGPNNVSGRALSLVSALLTVTVLAVSVRNGCSLWHLAIGWAAILGVNHRSGHYFAENRPDMPALLCATLAMVLFWRGQERRRGIYFVLGSTCLVIGFFIKQPVAMFSAVPLVVLLLRWRRPLRSEVVCALLPLAVSAGTIVMLKVSSPTIYHYMIEVPGGYAINWPRFAKFLWEVLLDSPLFLFLLGEWIVCDDQRLRDDARMPWLLAVLAVTIPLCSLAHAKVGGWPNSMLPALLALMAFCAFRLPRLLRRLEDVVTPLSARVLYATFLALLLLMTSFPHLTVANGPLVAKSPWDREYWTVVKIARILPGKVVCPEDPSIPLHAKHYACRNIFSEKDARPANGAWPTATPETVLAELRTAEFVVDITNYWGENVDENLLEELGFERYGRLSLDDECYRIWRRSAVNRASGPDNRTALLDTTEPTVNQSPRR
jgi:Dolichyl-phosphate-mannose-protein mannosyltransferase